MTPETIAEHLKGEVVDTHCLVGSDVRRYAPPESISKLAPLNDLVTGSSVRNAAVHRTGACRPVHLRAKSPRARDVNGRVAGEVDASTCEQGAIRQSLTGMVVGDKNRCIRVWFRREFAAVGDP